MQEIHVVGAAIRDGKKVLAAQRSAVMKPPLKWEFIGGKVEANESHHQALEREAYEELGIRIKPYKHIATGYSLSEERRIILHVYEASIIEGIPTAKEHSQLKWVDVSELRTLDWAEPDIPACEELIRKFRDGS